MHDVLKGIRVLDFGRYVAGPYCATLLGYFGAEVIRVEKPAGGEDRYIAPIADSDAGGLFLQTGCNKRSLTLDFRNDRAPEVVRRLIGSADVIVANLPPAALEKMGLDWDTVHDINPLAILATQTAFGSTGPMAEQGGFDGVAQAMSGALYMTGAPGEPVKAAAPYVDFSTAVLSAFGIMAALMDRYKTGQGLQVEGSLLHTAMAVFGSHLAEEAATAVGREPTGNRVQTSGPSDVFATRDGHVLTHVVGNGLFRRCARLLERDDWLGRADLTSDQGRGDARDELCDALADWCAARSTEEALGALRSAGLPCGPVLNLSQALELPQAEASGVFTEVDHPFSKESVRVVDLPLKFSGPTQSGARPGIHSPPPRLGSDTKAILGELGFEKQEIEALTTGSGAD